jgi:hypothetical protein
LPNRFPGHAQAQVKDRMAAAVLGQTTLSGREQIRGWGRQRAGATYCTRHVCTNMRFMADGDDAAEGTTVTTQHRGEDDEAGATLPRIVGEDHHRFVRTDQGWRFAARHWHQLFIS